MFSNVKVLFSLLVLAAFAATSYAMERELQVKVVEAFENWFADVAGPGPIRYQSPAYNDQLIPWLRGVANNKKIVEIEPSATTRYFIMPLDFHRRYDEFGVMYAKSKLHFAAFKMPWDETVAKFAGIGSVNSVPLTHARARFVDGIDTFLPRQYGVYLNIE